MVTPGISGFVNGTKAARAQFVNDSVSLLKEDLRKKIC